jgi:polysaccharide biosynthesis protein PslJ
MHAHRDTWRPSGLTLGLAGAAGAVATVAAAGLHLNVVITLTVLSAAMLAALTHRFFLRWEIQVSVIVLTILLIPLDRYELPGNLPFNLEPYRLLVALIVAGWCASLLGDPAMRWKRIGLFGPLLGIYFAVLASDALNIPRIEHYDIMPEVTKSLTQFVSYLLVLLFVTSVITRREQLDTVVKALVGGGAIVSFLSLVHYHTGLNIFDHFGVIPLLELSPGGIPADGLEQRGGGARVYASAEHPIALGAALAMLLPLGVYAGRRWGTRFWWFATALIGVAALATVARTGATMLLTVLVVFLLLKPLDMLRLWKWAIPFLIAVHLLAPGAMGSLKNAFFPQGGLIAEQQSAHSSVSSNRLADIGPGLQEWWQRPYFGYGFGTRITEPLNPKNNALILDNQWLSQLLEVGLAGTLALLWLMGRSFRRLAIGARGDPSPHGWLLAGIAAAIAAFGIGMITFDAFAFGQVTFLFFLLIGLAVPALRFARMPSGGVA